MNRALIFGIAIFFAVVGIALLGADNTAVAGHGCCGCNGGGGHCGGGGCLGGLFGGHGCHGNGHGCHGNSHGCCGHEQHHDACGCCGGGYSNGGSYNGGAPPTLRLPSPRLRGAPGCPGSQRVSPRSGWLPPR